MAFTFEVIDAAIKASVPRGVGFGGQCAAFAIALNRVLGGGGTYLCADGQHYEYVEHVALLFEGNIYDASGLINLSRLKEYADPDDGDEPAIIEIEDDSVRDLVDSTGGGICPPLNENLLGRRLKRALSMRRFRPLKAPCPPTSP
ncbi:hypothetical protein ACVIGB_000662 [Bradyrhizobium sp. USDA 4341]